LEETILKDVLLRRCRLLSDSFPFFDVDELVIWVLALGEDVGVTDDRADPIVELRQLDRLSARLLDADEAVQFIRLPVERADRVGLRQFLQVEPASFELHDGPLRPVSEVNGVPRHRCERVPERAGQMIDIRDRRHRTVLFILTDGGL